MSGPGRDTNLSRGGVLRGPDPVGSGRGRNRPRMHVGWNSTAGDQETSQRIRTTLIETKCNGSARGMRARWCGKGTVLDAGTIPDLIVDAQGVMVQV